MQWLGHRLQLHLRFSPWPKNFLMPVVAVKKKKKMKQGRKREREGGRKERREKERKEGNQLGKSYTFFH